MNNSDKNNACLLPVARVSKLFGTDGSLVINLIDTFPEGYDMQTPLFVIVDSLTVPLYPERFERRGRSGAVVSFADIDTSERASEFLGSELSAVFTDRASRESDGDEFYFEDMVGFTAFFTDDELKGTVVGFVDSEHNPLFTLSVDGNEVFVPATEDLIAGFDPDAKSVKFDLPEGLLDLYM